MAPTGMANPLIAPPATTAKATSPALPHRPRRSCQAGTRTTPITAASSEATAAAFQRRWIGSSHSGFMAPIVAHGQASGRALTVVGLDATAGRELHTMTSAAGIWLASADASWNAASHLDVRDATMPTAAALDGAMATSAS
jgi:hypothetical protein